jgi:DnaJ like chaperone protein
MPLNSQRGEPARPVGRRRIVTAVDPEEQGMNNLVVWGKLAGGLLGFMFGQWMGAAVGLLLGHQFDVGLARQRDARASSDSARRVQYEFFTAAFAVMGFVAKSDGRVSEEEIRVAREVMQRMQLSEEQKRSAIHLFNEGKQPDFALEDSLQRLFETARRHPDVLRSFMEVQLQAALADGEIHAEQRRVLLRACAVFGIPRSELERLELLVRRHGHSQPVSSTPAERLAECYRLLGVDRHASDGTVKQAYRRLMSQNHPDKLASRELPEEMVRLAEERTRQIREAYDVVRTARGMR